MDQDDASCEIFPTTPPELASNYGDYVCARAPSPGMDLLQFGESNDIQLWCHLHGYGDTAEAIPDDSAMQDTADKHSFPSGSSFQQRLRGIQARGWS